MIYLSTWKEGRERTLTFNAPDNALILTLLTHTFALALYLLVSKDLWG